MNYNQDTFINNLTRLMEENSLSSTQLAEIAGCPAPIMDAILMGTCAPSIDSVCKIADHFQITLDELITDTLKISRRKLATLLFDLYEKEAFTMDVRQEEKLFDTMGAAYPMDVTTVSLNFDDSMAFTYYGNYMVDFVSEWSDLVKRKKNISEETYTNLFNSLKMKLLENADDLDRMERMKEQSRKAEEAKAEEQKNAMDYFDGLYTYID